MQMGQSVLGMGTRLILAFSIIIHDLRMQILWLMWQSKSYPTLHTMVTSRVGALRSVSLFTRNSTTFSGALLHLVVVIWLNDQRSGISLMG